MLIQKQELRGVPGRHEKRQRLPLPAGKESHRIAHPILQSHPEKRKPLSERLSVLSGDGTGRAHGRRKRERVRLDVIISSFLSSSFSLSE